VSRGGDAGEDQRGVEVDRSPSTKGRVVVSFPSAPAEPTGYGGRGTARRFSLPDLTLLGHVSLPDLKLAGRAPIGAVPNWVTFTPDNKRLYISNAGARSMSVIDTQAMKAVATVPVGEVPKRINTLVMRWSLRCRRLAGHSFQVPVSVSRRLIRHNSCFS
jgi:YVTN family beta-propeller protein